jgi:hypothetical protein
VIVASSVQMTVYLWHIAAAAVAVGVLYAVGAPMLSAEPTTAAWWMLRPAWLTTAALALIPFVVVFRRFERPAPAPVDRSTGPAVVGALLVAGGLAHIAYFGLHLAAFPLGLPVLSLVPVGLGLWLLGFARRPAVTGGAVTLPR